MTTRGQCHAPGLGQSFIVTAPRPLLVFPEEDMVPLTTGAPVWTSGQCLRVVELGVTTRGDDKVHKVALTMKLFMLCCFVNVLSAFQDD